MTYRWRWRLLSVWIIVFTILVGVLLHQHRDQTRKAERAALAARMQNVNQQQLICAIRAYIEGQFAVTSHIEGASSAEVVARRRVIREFEDRMDGNCKP